MQNVIFPPFLQDPQMRVSYREVIFLFVSVCGAIRREKLKKSKQQRRRRIGDIKAAATRGSHHRQPFSVSCDVFFFLSFFPSLRLADSCVFLYIYTSSRVTLYKRKERNKARSITIGNRYFMKNNTNTRREGRRNKCSGISRRATVSLCKQSPVRISNPTKKKI